MISKIFKPMPSIFGLMLCMLLPQAGQCFYNPSTGRWLSRDPLEEGGGINVYSYVANDPLAYIDPTGDNFIAVGSRNLRLPILSIEHMSIEYFKEPCPKVEEGFRFNDLGQYSQTQDSDLLRRYKRQCQSCVG